MKEFFQHDNYINPNIRFIRNEYIVEYDMKEAGFSIIKEFNLLPISDIQRLQLMDNKKRHIEIGKMERQDKTISTNKLFHLREIRKQFIFDNDISEHEVISIKKDALLVRKYCDKCSYGDNIYFRNKNTYTSYMRLTDVKPAIELYYGLNKLDVKGISDDKLIYHQHGMLAFFNGLFKFLEESNDNKLYKYYNTFIDNYKNLHLNIDAYRQFDSISMLNKGDVLFELNSPTIDDVDISYNLMKILIPIAKYII